MARCPAHDDSTPSLSLAIANDGKLLVHCHAGCLQDAVIAALQELGLWPADDAGARPAHQPSCSRGERLDLERKHRVAAALRIWCEAQAARDTAVEKYLRGRGITVAPPQRLRLHPRLVHRCGSAWPCLVALVTTGPDDTPVGVHRTFLALDGTGKAPVTPSKMMLGPCRGGAVRLSALGEPLLIGEGIETCLSALQATGHATWAALSTSGLRALELPTAVRDVVVLADGDPPGEAAASAAAERWRRQGRRVRIARAPDGADFNDVLRRADVGSKAEGAP